jgi:hypothetical protein
MNDYGKEEEEKQANSNNVFDVWKTMGVKMVAAMVMTICNSGSV